jgi:hypothetical protein
MLLQLAKNAEALDPSMLTMRESPEAFKGQASKRVYSKKRLMIAAEPRVVWPLIVEAEHIPTWCLDVECVQFKAWQMSSHPNPAEHYRKVVYKNGTEANQLITEHEALQSFGVATFGGTALDEVRAYVHVERFGLISMADGTGLQFKSYSEYLETPDSSVQIRNLLKQQRKNLIYLKWLAERMARQTTVYS